MAKYKADWKEIESEDAPVLIAAVARYMSAEEYPSIDGVAAILGIEKVEEK